MSLAILALSITSVFIVLLFSFLMINFCGWLSFFVLVLSFCFSFSLSFNFFYYIPCFIRQIDIFGEGLKNTIFWILRFFNS